MVKVTTARSNQGPYQVLTSYTLWFLRYNPDMIFKLNVTMERSNQGHTMKLPTP